MLALSPWGSITRGATVTVQWEVWGPRLDKDKALLLCVAELKVSLVIKHAAFRQPDGAATVLLSNQPLGWLWFFMKPAGLAMPLT